MKKLIGFVVLATMALLVAIFYDTGPPGKQVDNVVPEINPFDVHYAVNAPAEPLSVSVITSTEPGQITGFYLFVDANTVMYLQEPEVPILEYGLGSVSDLFRTWPILTNDLCSYPLSRPIKQC